MKQIKIDYYELIRIIQYMLIKRGYGNQLQIQPIIVNNNIVDYMINVYKDNKVSNFILNLNDLLYMVREYYANCGYYVTHINSVYEENKIFYEVNILLNADKKLLMKRDV